MPYFLARLSFAISLSAVSASPDTHELSYGQRDGRLEAQAAVQIGAPWKLFAHAFNGRQTGFATPGLRFCDPHNASGEHFLPLPDADWQEGVMYSTKYYETAEQARRYAAAYNREMFRLRGAEIRVVCPKVELSV